MLIAINTRLLIKDKLEGIGWFTYETLYRITKSHPEHNFIFIFDRPYSQEFIFSKNVSAVVLNPPARHPLLWIIWFEISLTRWLRKTKPQLFISPDGFMPLRAKVDSLIVIHDINFAHRPKDIPLFARLYYNYFFPRFAQKAKKIVTVSNYSKNDIVQTYSVNKNKIDVVYNGSNPIYNAISEDEKEKIREKTCMGKKYFLFIGALHPRKNVSGLLKAFDKFKKQTGFEHKLVIVGEKMFKNKSLKDVFSSMEYSDEVVFLGRLSPADLNNVLGAAEALTFVPFFEGFGIPIIEAMNCDVPVLASNVTSLPEVAGDAAVYADPYSIESITKGLKELAEDETLRNQLIEKGREQREKFTWDKTAKRLWKSIDECLN